MSGAIDDLRSYFGRTAGLRLEAGQTCYAETRLASLMHAPEAANMARLMGHLDPDGTGPLARELLEALTCRETWFFRDRAPFTAFSSQLLPQLAHRRAQQRSLRVWSAGCSSGQEPWSLAICLHEARALLVDWFVEVHGTDISPMMIERAQRATFSHTEIQSGLPVATLLRYFDQLPEPENRPWRLKGGLAPMVTFAQHNLLGEAATLGRFDVIFCRNVLRHMHLGAQRIVLAHLAGQLAEDGFLVLGQDEHPFSLAESFCSIGDVPGIFARRLALPARGKRANHLRLVSSR